jgi:hypothetical protein
VLLPSALIISWNDAGMFCYGESCHLLESCLRKCTFLCRGVKPHSISRDSFWLPLTVMAPKVARTLRQTYAECRAASKVFSRPRPNMALYKYSMSVVSKVMYSVQGFFGVPKEMGSVVTPMGSIFFPLKP